MDTIKDYFEELSGDIDRCKDEEEANKLSDKAGAAKIVFAEIRGHISIAADSDLDAAMDVFFEHLEGRACKLQDRAEGVADEFRTGEE